MSSAARQRSLKRGLPHFQKEARFSGANREMGQAHFPATSNAHFSGTSMKMGQAHFSGSNAEMGQAHYSGANVEMGQALFLGGGPKGPSGSPR